MSLRGKKIVLIVSGGIAAYKAADLASKLGKAGAEVRVAMTGSAKRFIAPLTFEAITGHNAYCEHFGEADSYRMEHIEWARWADLLLVAPATADCLARMAAGLADEAALALYLAFEGPVWVAPAMNTKMWEHAATRANVKTLEARGVRMLGPAEGDLACGEVGEGRLLEPEAILEALGGDGGGSQGPLAGARVLITAGPTREALDPIRFISNRSSGRMGAALASEALALGARVVFIHGPLTAPIPAGVEAIEAESAEAMLAAVQENLGACRIAVFAAAVSNYRAADRAEQKIKGGERLSLELVRNPDIAAWAGHHRNGASPYLVGFAAESENLLEAAREKLSAKKLDLVFANPIGVPGVGFDADANHVTLIAAGEEIDSGRMPKDEAARWVWGRILERAGLESD